MTENITEKLTQNPFWPAGESIDAVGTNAKIMSPNTDFQDTAQAYADWMKRVQKHYPELYNAETIDSKNSSNKK